MSSDLFDDPPHHRRPAEGCRPRHPDLEAAEFDSVLRAAQSGAEWAWYRLYEWLAPSVRGYLRARGAASPDDLLGEVFVQLARNVGTFTGDAAGFRSWAFMVAHHRVIDEYRSRRADRSIVTDPQELPEPADGAGVETTVLASMSATQIRAWLHEHLTQEQEAIILLRIFGGMSTAEIADALGKRPGTVRVAHHRAVSKLRKVATEGGVTI